MYHETGLSKILGLWMFLSPTTVTSSRVASCHCQPLAEMHFAAQSAQMTSHAIRKIAKYCGRTQGHCSMFAKSYCTLQADLLHPRYCRESHDTCSVNSHCVSLCILDGGCMAVRNDMYLPVATQVDVLVRKDHTNHNLFHKHCTQGSGHSEQHDHRHNTTLVFSF